MQSTTSLLVLLLLGVAVRHVAAHVSGQQDEPPPVFDDLKNVMPYEPVVYSAANVSRAFRVTGRFNPRGMGHLYLVTNFFLDHLQRGDPLPRGFLRVENGELKLPTDLKREWPTLATHYGTTLILVGVLLLFGVLMPCAGFIFCCCRCAGRCGARSHAYEKRHDPCKRVSLGVLLSAFALVMLFGVVCAYVTNQYLEEGVDELPNDLRAGLSDTDLYLANTREEVHTLLVTNYRELQTVLNDILEASGEIVKDRLAEASKAVALNNLTAIVTGLRRIKADLHDINQVTRHLQGNASLLNSGLTDVRSRLLQRLDDCREPCKDVLNKYNIDGLSLKTDFNKLPDVSSSLRNVSQLIDTNIEREVMRGKKSFDDIQFRIQSSVNHTIPEIKDAIQRAGRACEKTSEDIIAVLEQVQQKIPQHLTPRVKQGEGYLQQYAVYRYYVDTTASTLLLLVLACLTFGLFYGFCGKRPDGMYGGDDHCCNKTTGGRYLMAGVYLMFLFSMCLAAVAAVHLLVGVLVEKSVCESLQPPSHQQQLFQQQRGIHGGGESQLLGLADQLVNLDHLYPKGGSAGVTVRHIIKSCHRNASIYEVLGLEAVVNVSKVAEFRQMYGIDAKLEQLEQKIRLNSKVVILTDAARKHLYDLANSSLSDIDFTAYNDLVENQITSIDLTKLATVLRETSEKLPPEHQDVKYYLQNEAMFLESSQSKTVDTMLLLSRQLRANSTALREDLKFNHSSLREAVTGLIREVQAAQEFLESKGPDQVIELARRFVEQFTRHIDEYLGRVIRVTRRDLGKCWPMSRVYNGTVQSVCSKIVNPFNGFWLSIGWSLALFLPAILVCVSLASLYSKADTYHGPLVDSEYLYDAYADRDNIPLANGGSSGGGGVSAAAAGGGGGALGGAHGAHQAARGNLRRPVSNDGARFRDAAPKHWDFPSGGPPHYNRNPPATEYERPPPYYYPGPGVGVAMARPGGPPPVRGHEVTGSCRSSASSSSDSVAGGAPPTVFMYQKLEALESRLYHGGASLAPASTWRRHVRPLRPSPRP